MPEVDYLYLLTETVYGVILMVAVVIFTFWAQISVQTTFNKYSKKENSARMTGAEVAETVLRLNGVRGVRIERAHGGHLSDHYDPRTHTIRLSDAVYDSASAAAAGVAAHEAGHAVQYAKEYFPVRVRSVVIPVTSFASKMATPLLLLGFFFGLTGFIWLGILAFAVSLVFQLVTLPCEFDASRRAMTAIGDSGYFNREDEKGARKVLTAAAMTYVAAMAMSLVYLLRYIALARRRR